MAPLPTSRRYSAALLLSHYLQRFVTCADAAKVRLQPSREVCLGLLLAILDGRSLRYDPPFCGTGLDTIEEGMRAGKGVLLVGFHETLTMLAPRYFADRGQDMLIVSANQRMMPGRGTEALTVPADHRTLFAFRRQWRSGGLALAVLDRERPAPGLIPCDTCRGPIYVAASIMDLAQRCGASVVFGHTKLSPEGYIAISFVRPSIVASQGIEALALDFGAFISRCMQRVHDA